MQRRPVLAILSLLGIETGRAGGAPVAQEYPGVHAGLLDSARAILALPKKRDAWAAYIVLDRHAADFIRVGEGAGIERWNAQHGKAAGKSDVDWKFAGTRQDCFLSYRGKTLRVPVAHDRDDDLAMLLTLNRLVKADAEIRFCIDSWHGSDLAFLALPPAAWRLLEAEYGAKAVAYRFMTLPDEVAAFWKAYKTAAGKSARRAYKA